MESAHMTFVFHHGGELKNDKGGLMIYEPDKTEVLTGVDVDTIDVFYVKEYHKKLGMKRSKVVDAKFLEWLLILG
ncbi:hypothetical protein PIB30_068281 [Stylosanthes scabra]|uniref:PB1-like domain-containing protein n=1 Tax=Stylosanthes scabra TaxID=79078 RepID=A0ABU6SPA5_9FABA|nr:hypothetical protein [Stylosanthes scabra]